MGPRLVQKSSPGSWPVSAVLQSGGTRRVTGVWVSPSSVQPRGRQVPCLLHSPPCTSCQASYWGDPHTQPNHPPKFRKLTKRDGNLEDEEGGPYCEAVLSHLPGRATVGRLGIHIPHSMPCVLPSVLYHTIPCPHTASTPSGPGLLHPLPTHCSPPVYLPALMTLAHLPTQEMVAGGALSKRSFLSPSKALHR